MAASPTPAGDQLGLKTLKTELETESARLKPQTESLTPEAINANPTLKAQAEALEQEGERVLAEVEAPSTRRHRESATTA